MKKLIIGLALALVCGTGITAMALSNEGANNLGKTVEVKPVNNLGQSTNNNDNDANNIKAEIEEYITSVYGTNWAVDLHDKNGEQWDDILERQLEIKFGHKYEDIIEYIIETKETEAGLDIDDIDDMYDDIDDNDDIDDMYDDIDDNDDIDDMYDDVDDDNDIDDMYDDVDEDNDIDDMYDNIDDDNNEI